MKLLKHFARVLLKYNKNPFLTISFVVAVIAQKRAESTSSRDIIKNVIVVIIPVAVCKNNLHKFDVQREGIKTQRTYNDKCNGKSKMS